ncbi:MAG TPA: ACT domain-containing protein, partial [Thermosynergistes sp.]|nr:ACT domain-containing protein [Thermosynergistes sp.]
GPLDFTCVGILASLSVPLSKAGVSIFAVSTYDTDYLLVKEKDLERTILVLNQEGHIVEQ